MLLQNVIAFPVQRKLGPCVYPYPFGFILPEQARLRAFQLGEPHVHFLEILIHQLPHERRIHAQKEIVLYAVFFSHLYDPGLYPLDFRFQDYELVVIVAQEILKPFPFHKRIMMQYEVPAPSSDIHFHAKFLGRFLQVFYCIHAMLDDDHSNKVKIMFIKH